MRTKKIISLFAAVAMVSTMFSSLVAFAAPAANSNPKITATVESVDSSNNAMIQFKLENNETLSYYDDWGYITSNGINAIQVKVNLDENVFDTSTSRIQAADTSFNVAGAGTSSFSFVFAPTTVGTYMIKVPAFLFKVRAKLKEGSTVPASAISYGECVVEYTSYNNVDPTTTAATTYTKYNVNSAATPDYTLTVGVDDTFKSNTPSGPVIGATTVNESPKTDNYTDYTNEDGEACYTQGFKATVAVSGNTGAAYNAYDAVITAKRGDDTETKTVSGLTFVSGTTVQNGNVVVKLNVQYVPEGVTLTLNSITPVVK